MEYRYIKIRPRGPKKAKDEYLSRAIYRPVTDCNTLRKELENEAVWIEEALTQTLDKYAKPIRITAYLTRRWSPEIQETRSRYARARRTYKLSENENGIKLAKNNFYIIVRKAKRIYWQKFLQGTIEHDPIESQKRRWTALKYISPKALSTTPAVKGKRGEVAITLEQKEELFLKSQFLSI
jgi:hypothetical protein